MLLDLDATFPQEVKDIYFEGLWKSQLVDGKNFQFPWYQGIAVELINKRIYEEGAGLAVADFPKTVGWPAGRLQDHPGQDRRRCATSASRSTTCSRR